MSQPDRNPNAKEPPKFTRPPAKTKTTPPLDHASNPNELDRRRNSNRPDTKGTDRQPQFQPPPLEAPSVDIPQLRRAPRAGQLNIRVTDEWRDWFSRQLQFIGAETGLKHAQLNALVVQYLGDSIDEIRYRAMRLVGLVDGEARDLDVNIDDTAD